MTDIARLQIRIESLEAAVASKRLDKLGNSSAKTERATDRLTKSYRNLTAPLVVASAALGATVGLVAKVQREFDVLNAGLITATGSSELAAEAFEALQEFAANTPYSLQQATEGFTKLVNLGLDPSERALKSYGNTASAMGKDLSQMVEAVADAATGEFERLKEFGIKAKSEGDRLKITFQGVTTEIGKNAAEIEDYLVALGENEFAGAMEQRVDTLDGALSNFGDSWDQLMLQIAELGLGDLIESTVRLATSALDALIGYLASGQMEGQLEALGSAWQGWGEDLGRVISSVTDFFIDEGKRQVESGEDTVDAIYDAFFVLPANIRALFQVIGSEMAYHFDVFVKEAQALKESFMAVFTSDTLAAAQGRLDQAYVDMENTRAGSIDSIMKERDATVELARAQMEAAKALRTAYDNKAPTGDRLAKFGIKRQPQSGSSSGGSGKADREAERRQKDIERQEKAQQQQLDSLISSLRTEEEAIAASYAERQSIISTSTQAGSILRQNLQVRSTELYEKELADLKEKRDQDLNNLRDSLKSEKQLIQESYEERQQIIANSVGLPESEREDLIAASERILDRELAAYERNQERKVEVLYNGLLTEQEMLVQAFEERKRLILENEEVTELERQELLGRLRKQFADEQQQAEIGRIQNQLSAAEGLFGGLADLAKNHAGEQSSAYRALFAVSKAFSVAQSILSIQTGLARAQELGFPANLAEMARVAAMGAGIISTINGSNFSGAYDSGGQIPAGKMGLVGEFGPEFIKGPANVSSRVDTAKMMEGKSEKSPPPAPVEPKFKIVNVLDPAIIGDYLATDSGEQLVMNIIKKNGG